MGNGDTINVKIIESKPVEVHTAKKKAVHNTTTNKSENCIWEPTMKERFDEIDMLDGRRDGEITKQNIEKYADAHGADAETVVKAFEFVKKADTNKSSNGTTKLDVNEFRKLTKNKAFEPTMKKIGLGDLINTSCKEDSNLSIVNPKQQVITTQNARQRAIDVLRASIGVGTKFEQFRNALVADPYSQKPLSAADYKLIDKEIRNSRLGDTSKGLMYYLDDEFTLGGSGSEDKFATEMYNRLQNMGLKRY